MTAAIILCGLVSLCVGAFLVGTTFGFFFLGAILVLLGIAAEYGNKTPAP